jgi:hypothetical protein
MIILKIIKVSEFNDQRHFLYRMSMVIMDPKGFFDLSRISKIDVFIFFSLKQKRVQ